MKIDPNIEYSWHQFKTLPEVRRLNESEQQRRYHFYLESLSNERYRQTKGREFEEGVILPLSGFLLQENDDYILQEDNSRIYL